MHEKYSQQIYFEILNLLLDNYLSSQNCHHCIDWATCIGVTCFITTAAHIKAKQRDQITEKSINIKAQNSAWQQNIQRI
jgi:hypothetical protein